MIKKYSHILLLHSNSARDVNTAALKIEREAFLNGYYFAFAIRYCYLCEACSLNIGKNCPFPEKKGLVINPSV